MSIYSVGEIKDEVILTFFEKTMYELNEFFGINWKVNRPRIYIYDSNKTADLLREGRREPWQIGWVEGNKVYVMAKEKIGVESPHKKIENISEYLVLIKHEIVHCFFNIVSKGSTKPDWLWEGMSIYLSGQLKNKKIPPRLVNFIGFYEKSGERVYKESGFAMNGTELAYFLRIT